jgi:hypothetical protein
VNEEGDKLMMLGNTGIALVPPVTGGVGGWTDESMRAQDVTEFGRVKRVNNTLGNFGEPAHQDATDMQKSLQQVIASQELMLTMFQDVLKGAAVSFADEARVPEECIRPKTE